MKRFLALILTLIMVFTTFVACNKSGDGAASTTADPVTTTAGEQGNASLPDKLYVGYSRANITPRDANGKVMAVPLAGYPFERIATEILTDLFASCTAVRDEEGDTVLLYSVDNLHLPIEIIGEIRNTIRNEMGINPKNVIITSSHAHSAPQMSNTTNIQIKKYKENILCKGVVEAAKAAIEDLTLCTELYAGRIETSGLNFIRRYVIDENGKLRHEIEGDHAMSVIKFVRDGKKDVILANWAAHCDTVITNNKYAVSGDYYYYFTELAEQELDAHVSIFNGTSGDVNPFSKIAAENTVNGTRPYGRKLANVMIENLSSLQKLDIVGDVEALSKTITLEIDHSRDDKRDKAYEIINLYNAEGESAAYKAKCKEYGIANIHEASRIYYNSYSPATETMNVYAVTIGNIAFGAAPYEMLTQTGADIRSNSKFALTFTCGYTNGSYGYIPPEYAYELGDYEVYSCQFVKGTAEKIQAEINALMDKLHADIYG